MKTISTIATAILLFTAANPVVAQHQHDDQATEQTGMTATAEMAGPMHNMMQGMMQRASSTGPDAMMMLMDDPFRRSALMTRLLPKMTERLLLSPEQVAKLAELSESYDTSTLQITSTADQAQEHLLGLVAAEARDQTSIKRLLREVAVLGADMKSLTLETADQMKAELSADQLERLKEMTPMQLHHVMATHMTMMEMMKMSARAMTPMGSMRSSSTKSEHSAIH